MPHGPFSRTSHTYTAAIAVVAFAAADGDTWRGASPPSLERALQEAATRARGHGMTTDRSGPFDGILKAAPEPAAPGGPDGPERMPVYIAGTIIGLAILIIVLILPPISVFDRGGGSGNNSSAPGIADSYTSTVRNSMPKLPAGLVAASPLFDLAAPENAQGASSLTVGPLNERQTDARSLGLYTYAENKWQRLSDVTLVNDGAAARGEVGSLPGNVVVLKKSRSTLQVAGSVPAGATVDERGASALTVVHPLAFLPTADGSIIGERPAVPPASYRVVPAVIAPVPEAVDTILRSSDLRSAHVAAIAGTVKEGNFHGILIDYRNVNPSLKEQFTEFAEALAAALHADAKVLTLTLPLPQQNAGEIDTGAYDWERLGAAADTIEIATELDQELYFQTAEAALDYVTSKVDRSKLLLSISSLSVERGGDGLRTMPLAEALGLASVVGIKAEGPVTAGAAVPLVAQNLAADEGGSGMAWDDVARAVTFSYPGRGGKRTVWIANQFSAAFRLELAQRFGLGGVAINDVSAVSAADVWSPIRELADTGTLSLVRPNGELFQPSWSATQGALTPQTGAAVTWTAPSVSGTYEITIVVSDGAVRAQQTVAIDVSEAVAPEGQ